MHKNPKKQLVISRFAITAIVVVALAVSGCADSEQKKQRFYQKGMEQYEAQNYREAILELRNAVRIDPNFDKGHLLLAKSYFHQQNWQKAYAHFSAAAELDPDLMESHIYLGRLLLMAGQTERAGDKVKLVLSHNPENFEARLILGTVLLRQGNYSESRKVFEEIIASDPGQYEPYVALSQLWHQQKKPAEALTVLDKGLEHLPESSVLLFRKAEIFLEQKEFAEVEAIYKKMRSLNPENEQLNLLMVRLHHQQGEIEKAIDELEQMIQRNPEQERLRLYLAQIYYERRDKDAAMETLLQAIEDITPGYDLRFALADFYVNSGMIPEAETLLLQTTHLDAESPRTPEAQSALARIYVEQGEIKNAESQLESVLSRSPGNIEALFMMGKIQLTQGRPDQAIVNLRRVVRDSPDNSEAYLLLARAHYMNNEPFVGTETLRQVINRIPQYIPARKELARHYLRTNDPARAIQELKRILEIDNNDRESRLLLGDVYAMQQNIKMAQQQYERLLDMDPQAAVMGHFNLGNLAFSEKNFTKAHRHYDDALKLIPTAYNIIEAKTLTFFAQRKTDDAKAFVMELVVNYPENPLLLDLLGRVETGLGNMENAERAFYKALELRPEWMVPYNRIASIYIRTGQLDKGIAAFEQAVAKNSESFHVSFILATLYHGSKKVEKAKSIYKDILEKKPDFIPAANNLAYLYAENTSDQVLLDRALELAVMAAATEEPLALDTLGWVHFKMGNHEMALEALNKAWDKSPNNQDIGYHLAVVLKTIKSTERAKTILESLIQTYGQDGLNKQTIELYQNL